jgi:hypothetical protein
MARKHGESPHLRRGELCRPAPRPGDYDLHLRALFTPAGS